MRLTFFQAKSEEKTFSRIIPRPFGKGGNNNITRQRGGVQFVDGLWPTTYVIAFHKSSTH
jgi:hypothetical protein